MDLPLIIAAPMAGGPSTPALVSAVSFGFLAWGTSSLDQARSEIEQVEGSFGINLFYPQDFRPDLGDIEQVAADLGAEVPEVDLSNGYQQKLRLALDAGPAVISSTFGCFTASEVELIHGRGCEAWVTVTNEADARTAIMRGVDCLVVQGPRAGGHRGTWSPELEPDTRSLGVLLEAIVPFGVPVVAAGGARDASGVERLLASGAARRGRPQCSVARFFGTLGTGRGNGIHANPPRHAADLPVPQTHGARQSVLPGRRRLRGDLQRAGPGD